MIELNAPLIIIDVETTGPHRKVDRIIQIGLTKLHPDGGRTSWKTYVNPTIPIPPEVTEEVHHITDDMVKDAPTFADLAPKLAAGFKGCDYGGYSVSFDIGFFEEEFSRITTQKIMNGRVVDVMKIFFKYNPRSLADAVQEYLGRPMKEGAHDAGVDVDETLLVLEAQLDRHTDLPRTVEGLYTMFFETPRSGQIDPEGKLYWRYGEACMNFGDNAGTPLREVSVSYLNWILKKDFSEGFKTIVRNALAGVYPRKIA